MKNQFDASDTIESHIYYNTREVASMLGLSRGTVQKMVEDGTLQAWKTSGGHRRILGSAVENFLKNGQSAIPSNQPLQLSILVIEDDPALQKLYESTITGWEMPIDLNIVDDGLSALVQITRQCPNILISDLQMQAVDGFEMINTLGKDSSFNVMDIIVVTELTKADIDNKGSLPHGVTVFHKPIPFQDIHGYARAKLVSLAKDNPFSS
ncbi:excisionase family DNA-binding protein [Methylobacter sp. S3L5C]|uniref:excisionase family DNA-binding protein n=1 Tax=Methylobacter sp. S3L5C TaxID=2839024 RepID=UPI001FAC05A1|nr:excisionase family DNA-binding protein [Methylobacter sp. S3L5C]UOA10349.1 excisionase family DNA-binding protein [Methylobacter sp. S3L5C]